MTSSRLTPRLAALLIPLVQLPTRAADHHIRPGESIQVAIDTAAAGDTITLDAGVYFERLHIDRPLILRAKISGTVLVSNRSPQRLAWKLSPGTTRTWFALGVNWPVHWLWVEGVHAFDYRTRANFDARACGPFWSKGWQDGLTAYAVPPLAFACDEATDTLWLRLDNDRDPNDLDIALNSAGLDNTTLLQKDLGTAWNQQQIVTLGPAPAEDPVVMWYAGTPDEPAEPRRIDYPRGCGVLIEIDADDVVIEGLRLSVGPTVIVDVNDSHRVTIRDCHFSGYQFGLNTGYRCTKLTVEHCEFDGGLVWSRGGHRDINANMWYHSTYIVPVSFKGTGLTFRHNYVHEGYDLFQPRGRHKDYPDVPDLRSEVAYNVWQNAVDNVFEFDGVEARMNLRAHHNLIIADHDALAITTTENGGPLTIDHNLWWPGGGRIMKLVGTGRVNRGVQFLHNTYFTGDRPSHNTFEASVFENNLVISGASNPGDWTPASLGEFFPTRYNLLHDGQRYTTGFTGLTAAPGLGNTPATRFTLQADSPALDAGRADLTYPQINVTDGRPDLGALEYGETIESWRAAFSRCGPRWLTSDLLASGAFVRPAWPAALDRSWGGLDTSPATDRDDSGTDRVNLSPDRLIPFKATNRDPLQLHVFLPSGKLPNTPKPAVLFFFGGGWVLGSADRFYPQAAFLARAGIIAISSDYRTYQSHGTTPQDAVADAIAAMSWVRRHASELGIDPHRIVASGGSAGGHLAACLAFIDPTELDPSHKYADTIIRPDALVLFNPVLDLSTRQDRAGPNWRPISPLEHLSPAWPPILIMNGTNDAETSVNLARQTIATLAAAGVDASLIEYDGQAHGFFNYVHRENFDLTMTATVAFLNRIGFLDSL